VAGADGVGFVVGGATVAGGGLRVVGFGLGDAFVVGSRVGVG
jgi:hypothetical protein